MHSDSINDEVRRIKHELAAKFDHDVVRIAADARARQVNVVRRPPCPHPPQAERPCPHPTPEQH